MRILADLDARAVLCRRLAELEPRHRRLWLAEADKWLHLARADLRPAPQAFRRPVGMRLAWLRRPLRRV